MSIFSRLYHILRSEFRAWSSAGGSGHGFREHAGNEGFYRPPPYGERAGEQSRERSEPGSETHPKIREYYAMLEIPHGSDLETARKAWKRLLRKYHPDFHSQDHEKQALAGEITQRLNEAFRAIEEHLKEA